MASMVADNTYHMLSRHMGSPEDADFPLYPDQTQNAFVQQTYVNMQNFDVDHSLYGFARTTTHAPFPSSGFPQTAMYADVDPSASSYALESPELRAGASSNYSTASGASATSSTMGSQAQPGHREVRQLQPQWQRVQFPSRIRYGRVCFRV
jgi:hypothetical protein